MKNFFNATKNLLIVAATICYLLFIPLASLLLLHKNEYGISEINDKYFLVIDEALENDNYKNNTLVIINKIKKTNLTEKQEIFVYNDEEISISNIEKIKEEDNITYVILKNNKKIEESKILGVVDKKYNNIGVFVNFVETKLGFIIFMIFPCIIMFIYGMILLIIALNNKKNKKVKKEIIIDENKKIIEILEEKIFDNIEYNEKNNINTEKKISDKKNKIEDLIDEIGIIRKEYDEQNTFTQEIPILNEKEVSITETKEIKKQSNNKKTKEIKNHKNNKEKQQHNNKNSYKKNQNKRRTPLNKNIKTKK